MYPMCSLTETVPFERSPFELYKCMATQRPTSNSTLDATMVYLTLCYRILTTTPIKTATIECYGIYSLPASVLLFHCPANPHSLRDEVRALLKAKRFVKC